MLSLGEMHFKAYVAAVLDFTGHISAMKAEEGSEEC